jgi:hypothetical protein
VHGDVVLALELVREFPQAGAITGDEDQVDAVRSQKTGKFEPDAARGSCD